MNFPFGLDRNYLFYGTPFSTNMFLKMKKKAQVDKRLQRANITGPNPDNYRRCKWVMMNPPQAVDSERPMEASLKQTLNKRPDS